MAEEGLAVAPEAGTTPAPETTYFNSDGTLVEGWQGTLDEGLREEKSLSTFKTVGDLAKSFVTTKSMVGKNTMEIPTETSDQGVWEAYHKAGGRPETVEDYGLKAPDGMDEGIAKKIFPEGRLAKWQERFFKGGVSQKAAGSFIADFAADMLVDLQAINQAKEQQESELISNLSTEWGAAYDQKIHFGNIAIEEGTAGDTEFKARIVEKVRLDADLTKLLGTLGGKFGEGKSPNLTNIPTPADLQSQIDTIEANPLYLQGTLKQRQPLIDKVMALRTKMIQDKTT